MASERNVYLILILVQMIFGINVMVTKVIVGSMQPISWAIVRLLTAGVILLSICFWRRPEKLNLSWDYLKKIFLLSIIGMSLSQFLFLEGISKTTATNASIITSLIPLFTLLVVTVLGHERLNSSKIIGFLVALLGVLILRRAEDFSLRDSSVIGDILVFLCTVSTALFIALSRSFLRDNDHWWATGWMFLFGGLQLLFVSFFIKTSFAITLTPELTYSIIYSIFLSTLFAYFLNLGQFEIK